MFKTVEAYVNEIKQVQLKQDNLTQSLEENIKSLQENNEENVDQISLEHESYNLEMQELEYYLKLLNYEMKNLIEQKEKEEEY